MNLQPGTKYSFLPSGPYAGATRLGLIWMKDMTTELDPAE